MWPTVAPGVKPVYTIVTANGKPAVLLNINRQPDSNTVAVADEVHAEIERIRQNLPPGIQIEPFYDQSEIVTDSIKSVRDAILIGLILASIIMVLFLRDWGASAVAGLVIPVTVLVTFIALKALGESFNLMTLGGLAAAVGLVIDDAIVVVENVACIAMPDRNAWRQFAARWRNYCSAGRFDHHADCGVPSADRDHRRHRSVLSRAGHYGRRVAADVARPGVDLDTDAQPILHSPKQLTCRWTAIARRRKAACWPPKKRLSVRASAESSSSTNAACVSRCNVRAGLRCSAAVLVVASFFCYQGAGLGPAAGDGRRRIRARLHYAGGNLAGRNQSHDQPHRTDAARHSRSGELTRGAPACNSGLAAVTEANTGDIAVKLKEQAQPRRRRDHGRSAHPDPAAGARGRRRVHPGAAGHDRRSVERARADPDQAVLAGRGAAG